MKIFEYHSGGEIFFLNIDHIMWGPKDCSEITLSDGRWIRIERQNERENLRKLLGI